MPRVELLPYHKDLAEILKSEGNPEFRKNFLVGERLKPQYKNAKEAAKRRNLALREISKQDSINAGDESSQALPVVGNPLVDLKPAERELTPQEQTVLWANQVFEEHNNLPKRNSAERRVARNLVTQTARSLVQNPADIDIAGSVWKSRETASENQQPTDSFYGEVKKESSAAIRKNWETVTPEQLAQLVKVYANSILTQDFGHDLLANYFKGPNSRNQKVDALYNFALGALDLIENQRALEEAVKIGQFETPLLPRESGFFRDIQIAMGGLTSNEQEELSLKKALITQRVLADMTTLTSLDYDQIFSRDQDYIERDEKLQDTKTLALEQAKRSDEVKNRIEAMREYGSNEGDVNTLEIKRLGNVWPYSLVLDEDDPLTRKCKEIAKETIEAQWNKQNIIQEMEKKGIKDIAFISVALPEGFVIDVCAPQEALTGRRNETIREVINFNFRGVDKDYVQEESSFFTVHMAWTWKQLGDSPIHLTLRKPSGFESNQHPLQSLELIGFPNPSTEVGQDMSAVNEELADDIKRTQLRFLNKRGVRVPVKNTALGDFGYSHIDFQKDSDDLSKTVVKIFVGDVPYSVKLDQYFNFDFEGKKFNAPFIQDSLRYTILSYLKPILCDDRVINAKGEKRDLDAEVVSRMGHLMLLPSDRHRSVQAIVNCFRIEGKDLIALDAERREIQRKAGNRVPEEREYTYRRPVIEKEENLPPIIINLPGVLKFRNT